MLPNAFNSALLFLISTLFDLYLCILIIRLILVWARTDYYHPFTKFIVTLTQFLVNPLRRILPNIGRFETASFVLIFVLEILKFLLISLLSIGTPNFIGLPILAVADMIKLVLNTFFYAILLQVILSWVQPFSPLNSILNRVTSPIMYPIQRVVPPVAGIDISPIPALILLQLLIILLVNPLMAFGVNIAFG